MARLTIIPDNTKIDFVGQRYLAFAIDGLLVVATILSLWFQGLNLGIDFTGGVVVEARSAQAIDIGALREKLGKLDFGEVAIQNFGGDKDVLIRVQPSSKVIGQEQAVADKIKAALGSGYTFNRVEAVGPKVSGELFQSSVIATVLAILMIAVYVAFRFEWQFGVAGLLATGHDVLVAVGMYSILQFDFNLTSVAALLLLAGYSINDTVVVFDRIRENRRKFKSLALTELINSSTNQTLSRTFLTSFTTALSVLPLLLFGGEALFGFAATILWGIIVGTYSSVFVASCLLLYMPTIKSGQAKTESAGAVV
ncbi:MAG: protein translocase subunit SecF [Alphaproteobacteria bacterium]|nr:protein translocase subunit SecF [Alphaproteobacteria bacterium]